MNLKNLILYQSICAFGAVKSQNEDDDFFIFNLKGINYFSFKKLYIRIPLF
jgi:hypothetical protein